MTEPKILDEDAVSEIEALRHRNTGPSFGYTHELCVAIDALCATVTNLRAQLSGLSPEKRLQHQEDKPMKNYEHFRAGMLRAAEMARDEFKRAPEAAKGHDCVYMGGYEDACDHLSVVIAQAAVIDSVRIAGSQPDWQYHISLLLPDDAVEDAALLKIYQVVEHELRNAATLMRDKCVEKVRSLAEDYNHAWARQALVEAARELQSVTLDQVKPGEM